MNEITKAAIKDITKAILGLIPGSALYSQVAGHPRRTVWVTQSQETTSCDLGQQSDVRHHTNRRLKFLVAEAARTMRPGYPPA